MTATGLTIHYEENAQAELITPSGRRILIDIADPSTLSKPATKDDILLTTHIHGDHYNREYVAAFAGQKITIEEKQLVFDDVSISSIPAGHDDGSAISPKDGSDYILVIDIVGLRVVHFGDFGQSVVFADQMEKIGKVDVALSQLANSYSSMDVTNQKGFNQMKQVKPSILIPTHYNADAARLASETWPATYSTKPLVIAAGDLPPQMTVVFMGKRAAEYGAMLELQPSSW